MAKKSAHSTPAKAPTQTPVNATATKPNTPASVPAQVSPSKPVTTTPALSPRSSPQEIAYHVWNRYLNDTPARTKLLDVFMVFLVVVGGLQFVYCVIAGNYPFNAFLSGFSAAVGQFVLTASLRMQTSERSPATSSAASKKASTKTIDGVTGEVIDEGTSKISSERAFADFIFGSLILHAFCINFIN